MTTRSAALAVVVNPVTARDEAAAIREYLSAHDIAAGWLETSEDDPGSGQARDAVAQGANVVVACGGDGTVRACIEALAGTEAALAIVPAGTGNLLARNLEIPTDPVEALQVAIKGARRRIDVGFVNGEAFAVMAGAGLDAVVMRDTDRAAKDRFGFLAYVKTAVQHLRDKPRRAVASADGGPVFSGRAATVLGINLGGLQGNVDLAPDSEPDDGRLDFVAIRANSPWSWLRAGWAILTGKRRDKTITRWSGPDTEIVLGAPTPYELDGDERPATTRLKFSVQPSALEVCVPEATP